MGRKSTFDREEALQEALKCFWMHGYDKTSLEDLLRAMGIKTSSFYHSFESKEALFLEAVQYYRKQMSSVRIDLLRTEEIKGKDALLKYFDHLIHRTGRDDYPPGCFMMKTAANLVEPDSTVGREVATGIANLEKAFVVALERGQAGGDLDLSIPPEQAARILLTVAYGISVLTRTKKSKKELLSTAHAFIAVLSPKS